MSFCNFDKTNESINKFYLIIFKLLGAISSSSKNGNETSIEVVQHQEHLKLPNTERLENKDKSSKILIPFKNNTSTSQVYIFK